jgi:predicted nucleotidyltransferase
MSAVESSSLPSEHRQVLDRVVAFFRAQPGVVGMSVAGSIAGGFADEHSDLDVGVFFADADARKRVWAERWDWDLGRWFHRFDADHIRPYFVIYLLDPGIKTDIPLNLVTDAPTPGGAPYDVLWDDTGDVTRWVEASNSGRVELPPDWSDAAHEDEQLWGWLYYSVLHMRRGEYYDLAYDFNMIRNIVETWHARLTGSGFFEVRRVHEREPETMSEFADLFPRPEHDSLKCAFRKLIDLHEGQRARIDWVEWRTSAEGREKIRRWIEEL